MDTNNLDEVLNADGLEFDPHFSAEDLDTHPYDEVEWDTFTAEITNMEGEYLFRQEGVVFPSFWNQKPINIVASKYFYGDNDDEHKDPSPEGGREYSLKQLIDRVVDSLATRGIEDNLFKTRRDAVQWARELKWLCLHQHGAFNSPVWFNVGLGQKYGITQPDESNWQWGTDQEGNVSRVDPYERPQGSACFIVDVQDTLEDIFHSMTEAARLFKHGSGVGADWSKLRSTKDKLSGGGQPSGPVSFMRVQDEVGGTIKSGGKCLAPDQKVYTAEHGAVKASRLIEKEFTVLSYHPPAGRVMAKRAQAWTSQEKEVLRVKTDKGTFEVSRDHPFRLEGTGEVVRAEDLEGGNRLQRVNTFGHNTGHVKVGIRDGDGGKMLVHRLVAQDVMSVEMGDKAVHHKDENPLNNAPENLEVMSQAKHAQKHGKKLANEGDHTFQNVDEGDERFDKSGENNGMHRSSEFWEDEEKVATYQGKQREEMTQNRDPSEMQKSAVVQRYLNNGWELINKGYDISTEEKYRDAYYEELGRKHKQNWERKKEGFQKHFGGYQSFLDALDEHNHKVLSVESVGVKPVVSVEVFCDTPDDKSSESGHTYVIAPMEAEGHAMSGVVSLNTRRAAIMQTLKSWHPDVREFVKVKAREEKKAHALIEEGYDGSFNGPAYGTVAFQNVNQSLRADNEFMNKARDNRQAKRDSGSGEPIENYDLFSPYTDEALDTCDPDEVMELISEGTWVCGDPGMQFEDTIQAWHTVPNFAPIDSSNPCVTGDTLVSTSEGPMRIDSLVGKNPEVVGLDGDLHRASRVVQTGTKPVYRMRTKAGFDLKLTGDHKVWTENSGDVPASDLKEEDRVSLIPPRFGNESITRDQALYAGMMLGDGCVSGDMAVLTMSPENEEQVIERAVDAVNMFTREKKGGHVGTTAVQVTESDTSLRLSTGARSVREFLSSYTVLDEGSEEKKLSDLGLTLDRESLRLVLRGLFAADGTVADYGEKTQYVALDSTSEELLQQVQQLLLGFGIKAKLYRNRRTESVATLPDGQGGEKEYEVKQVHALRISRSSREVFENEIGFIAESDKSEKLAAMNDRVSTYRDNMTDEVVSLTPLGEEPVYDLTEPDTDHFVAGGIAVHNCSEFLHPDNTACNLASLNTMKFRTEDEDETAGIDMEGLEKAARVFITGQEILVGFSGYPSGKIAKNSYKLRPLGLGFANVGALVMSMGYPYDSDKGRAVVSGIQAIEHFSAYEQSAQMAKAVGPFEEYEDNADEMMEVMKMHKEAAVKMQGDECDFVAGNGKLGVISNLWDRAVELGERVVTSGEKYGYRNSQATVIAPTGTIGFYMDCTTKGIEPDIALVKHKLLAGEEDSTVKMVNKTVPLALDNLGYDQEPPEGEHEEVQTIGMLPNFPEVEVGTMKHAILNYIDQNGTIEGAPYIKDEHLPIFDCAITPPQGKRSIHHNGHIDMMGAVQPFVSGAISKTVNLPEEATVDDLYDAYMRSWDKGLKAVAIYRDGSKRSQPMSAGGEEEDLAEQLEADRLIEALEEEGFIKHELEGHPVITEEGFSQELETRFSEPTISDVLEAYQREEVSEFAILDMFNLTHLANGSGDGSAENVSRETSGVKPTRYRLPDDRPSWTHKFQIGQHEGYLNVGVYPPGYGHGLDLTPGEVFIVLSKQGSSLNGFADQWATALSIMLQYGVPLEDICEKFEHVQFEPSGFTGNEEIRSANSVVDYVSRLLKKKFVEGDGVPFTVEA